MGAMGGVEPAPIQSGRAAPPGTYGDLDVVRYDAVVGLPSPGGTVVDGVATLLVRPAGTGVSQAVLDFTGLAVLGVAVDGVAVQAVHADGRLRVPLPPDATGADTFAIRVEYRGAPDDGLILGLDARGRSAAFVDNWPNRTRFWLPSVDHPSDKATASLTVHAPEGWRVVSNGNLVSEDGQAPPAPDGSPRRAWRWQTEEYYMALKMEGVPTAMNRFNNEWHGTSSTPSNFLRTQLYHREWFKRWSRKPGVSQ